MEIRIFTNSATEFRMGDDIFNQCNCCVSFYDAKLLIKDPNNPLNTTGDRHNLIGFDLKKVAHNGIINKYIDTKIGTFMNRNISNNEYANIMQGEAGEVVTNFLMFNYGVMSPMSCRYRGRYILKDTTTQEIKLYDQYYICPTGYSTVYILIEVAQNSMPLVRNEDYISKLKENCLMINDYFLHRKDRCENFCYRMTKFLDARTTSVYDVFDDLNKLIEARTQKSFDSLSNKLMERTREFRSEYRTNLIAMKNLLQFGFHMHTIRRIKYKDCVNADLNKLFENLLNATQYTGNESEYIWCQDCNSVHNPELKDNLVVKYDIKGILDENGDVIDEDDGLCIACALEKIGICQHCGRAYLMYGNRDDYCECIYCEEEHSKYKIRRYHENPPTVYYDYDKEKGENFIDEGADPVYWGGYGVELEVGNGGEKDSESEKVIKILDNEVYAMHDGSIFNEDDYEGGDSYDCGGFEIITFPHTKEALLNMKWEKAFKHLLKSNYRSHDIKTCGLHLHISRSLFHTKDSVLKMMYFYEINYEDVCNFARRRKQDALRWANTYNSLDYIEGVEPQDLLKNLKRCLENYDLQNNHSLRYKCVNLQKRNTIEIRIMRGTLNTATFFATLDFLIHIAEKSNYISWDDVLNNDFDVWFDGLKPETIEYMKTRGCFNKPKEYAFPNNPEQKEAEEITETVETVEPADGNRILWRTVDDPVETYRELAQSRQITDEELAEWRQNWLGLQDALVMPETSTYIITNSDEEYPF